MANAPRETIGKYRIIATLGFGSQGAVYRARDETLGREVALKVLHPHLATPDLIERFQREARIIASIPHPNIAGVSEIGEHDGRHYIAIEYVPHTLAELMERGPLDVMRAVSIAHQTALALEAARASENAITHHDVKPDNILLTSLDSGGVVKLIDFGIAHAEGMTSITQTGSQWGTPLYMPPEQWAGERGDARSDIYSLGVVLYHTLAGHPPFDSDAANNVVKQTEIARQHQQAAAPPLRSMRGDIPEAMDAIIAKCMAKPPSARCQTPGELATALAGMLGQAARPSDPKPEPRPSPPKPRNRMPLIAAAGFGAIIMAVLAAMVIFQSGELRAGFAAAQGSGRVAGGYAHAVPASADIHAVADQHAGAHFHASANADADEYPDARAHFRACACADEYADAHAYFHAHTVADEYAHAHFHAHAGADSTDIHAVADEYANARHTRHRHRTRRATHSHAHADSHCCAHADSYCCAHARRHAYADSAYSAGDYSERLAQRGSDNHRRQLRVWLHRQRGRAGCHQRPRRGGIRKRQGDSVRGRRIRGARPGRGQPRRSRRFIHNGFARIPAARARRFRQRIARRNRSGDGLSAGRLRDHNAGGGVLQAELRRRRAYSDGRRHQPRR